MLLKQNGQKVIRFSVRLSELRFKEVSQSACPARVTETA